eukprot:10941503-Lingulodinium_polyedra.AAC.1
MWRQVEAPTHAARVCVGLARRLVAAAGRARAGGPPADWWEIRTLSARLRGLDVELAGDGWT